MDIYMCVCECIYTYAQQSAYQNLMHQIQLRSIPCPPPSESASRDFSCLFSRWRWTVSWSRTLGLQWTQDHILTISHNVMLSINQLKDVERCHQSRWAAMGIYRHNYDICWHMLRMKSTNLSSLHMSIRRLRRLIKWYFWIFDTGRWARKIEA